VISGSPTDVRPVFDAVLDRALTLCEASNGSLYQLEDRALRHVGARGIGAITAVGGVLSLESAPGWAVLEKRTVHIEDVLQELDRMAPEVEAGVRRVGVRTVVAVPLLREQTAIGAIFIRRLEVRRFSEKQIRLLQTFADQAVIAIENVRLFTELQASNRELTTALDKQTATSDILAVISRSQTDVQPVFDAILASAVRLLGAHQGALTRVVGDHIELAASTLPGNEEPALRAAAAEGSHAQVVHERAPVNIADMQTDPRVSEGRRALARAHGYRSLVTVPLLRQDEALGAIAVTRPDPGGFAADEIALLRTFADQAVIAIENVRLFTELEARNRDLTATSQILQVISSSPTDVQPIFEAIVESAARLCDAFNAAVVSFDGELMRLEATRNWTPEAFDVTRRVTHAPPSRAVSTGRAILERAVVHVPDVERDPEYLPELGHAGGFRSVLAVPMLRDGVPLGAITVGRAEPGPFSDNQIALLKTFADQAVIAIENVRLFTELQTSNRDLTTALDTQTATSDILRVISRSQTDVQPVFEAIVQSAVRLLHGYYGAVIRVLGDRLERVATTGAAGAEVPAWTNLQRPLHGESVHAQAIRARAPLNFADVLTDPRVLEELRGIARATGYRSLAVVPLLRQDEALGTIAVTRRAPGGFTDDEIALLQTFADQAVIAIENARLLSELQARTQELTRSVGELTALGEVGRALSSTLDVDVVLDTIVARANDLIGADGCTIFEYDETTEQFYLRATRNLEPRLVALARGTPLRKGDQGILGQLPVRREAVQVSDITDGSYSSPISDALIEAGYRAVVAVPLIREDHLIGALAMNRKTPGAFPPETIELLHTFATQSALAIQNARLFREIEIKSRELESASQHKSEFLASMSHELRTPLNAIIGFSEVLLAGMFGETNEKQTEYLRDILASGQHLLSLINDILDLSKIEAGRMELELGDFELPAAIDDALLLMRERAGRRGLSLERHVDERLGEVRADQRKVKQVLLNLLSNAVKFTPEGGRIDVRAAIVGGTVEVAVTDTGIGIAPEDQEAVFEEFRQVGKSDKKAEGTGLGLALCRKFVELHGGRIWVKSQVGQGSTFTFTLPVRREPSDRGGAPSLIS
jgi:GAF domain-containing protein